MRINFAERRHQDMQLNKLNKTNRTNANVTLNNILRQSHRINPPKLMIILAKGSQNSALLLFSLTAKHLACPFPNTIFLALSSSSISPHGTTLQCGLISRAMQSKSHASTFARSDFESAFTLSDDEFSESPKLDRPVSLRGFRREEGSCDGGVSDTG